MIRLHDFIGRAAGDIESHEYLRYTPAFRVGRISPEIIILLAPLNVLFKRPLESSQLSSLLLNSPLLFIILTSPLEIFHINYSSALIRSGYIKHLLLSATIFPLSSPSRDRGEGTLPSVGVDAFNLFYTGPLLNVNSRTMKRLGSTLWKRVLD